jgi:hypothetical protein
MEHLDLELTDSLSSLFNGAADFSKEVDWRGLGLRKNVDMIRCHPFLCNENLFGSVDDEITSRIVRTLVQVE